MGPRRMDWQMNQFRRRGSLPFLRQSLVDKEDMESKGVPSAWAAPRSSRNIRERFISVSGSGSEGEILIGGAIYTLGDGDFTRGL